MRTLLSRRQRSPIALDVQPSHVTAVQLQRRGGQWTPAVSVTLRRPSPTGDESTAQAPLSLSDGEWKALEQSLKRQGVVGEAVVLPAPPSASCVQLLELPPRTKDTPIDALARAEMARLARWDDSTPFQLQTWPVPPPPARGTNGSTDTAPPTALGAAALQEHAVTGLIDSLADRGWRVTAVVAAPLAAAQAARSAAASDGASVIVDICWDRSSLTIVRDRTPLYHRDLPDNGLSLLARGLVAELRLSATDAATAIHSGTLAANDVQQRSHALCEGFLESLAVEIEATLTFVARRYGGVAAQRVAVVGEGTQILGIEEALSTRLDLPARTDSATPSERSLALCVAAAELSAARPDDRGLLPVSQRVALQRERLARRWAVALGSVASVATVAVSLLYTLSIGPVGPQEARLQAMTRDHTRLTAEANGYASKVAQRQAVASFEDRLMTQPDFSELLRVLNTAIAPAASLDDLSIIAPVAEVRTTTSIPRRPALRRLRLSGTAADPDSLTAQVAALRAVDLFDGVELTRTTRSADGRGVTFEITFNLVAPTSMPTPTPTNANPRGGAS